MDDKIISISILALTFLIAFLVNRYSYRLIQSSAVVLKNDPTNYRFLRHLIIALIYAVGISLAVYVIPEMRTAANSLLAGAGILAVAIGFASQQVLSNIISGVFIVLFKPFRINDRLKVQNFEGFVEDITLRHTVIRDFENKRIIVPNSLISEEILVNANFEEESVCKWINVSISFGSKIEIAKAIVAEEIEKHPLCLDVRKAEKIEEGAPVVVVRVLGFGESGVNLRAWAWAANAADAFVLSCDVYESIKKRFDEADVEIPVPHRAVIVKTKEK